MDPFIAAFILIHVDAPESVTLITNLTTNHKVCSGMVANFTCVVEASNPAVDNFTLIGNGSVVSSKRDSGVWIRTLTIRGNATYKCTTSNSLGVSSSDYINFTVEGETGEFFRITSHFKTAFN